MGPTIFELWVMKTKNWVTEIGKPNTPLISDFLSLSLSLSSTLSPSLLFDQQQR